MKRTLLVLVVAACGSDDPIDPGPDASTEAKFCASSTDPETAPAWQACRAANVDSWPLVCDAGQVAPPCAFEATDANGEAVICRPAGACE